jgi:SAM-dependent methyltransferase
MTQRDWNGEWIDGRWDFLAGERERLRVAASMIGRYGPGRLVDLGSGDGQLLHHLDPSRTPRCLCVDLSRDALRRLPQIPGIDTETMVADLESFAPGPQAADALSCLEILYYLPAPAEILTRWVRACPGVRAVVISWADPERFPAWRSPVAALRRSVDALGWPLLSAEAVEQEGQRWSVAAFRPVACHG